MTSRLLTFNEWVLLGFSMVNLKKSSILLWGYNFTAYYPMLVVKQPATILRYPTRTLSGLSTRYIPRKTPLLEASIGCSFTSWDVAHQFVHWYLLHSDTLVLEATTGFSMQVKKQATMHATKWRTSSHILSMSLIISLMVLIFDPYIVSLNWLSQFRHQDSRRSTVWLPFVRS